MSAELEAVLCRQDGVLTQSASGRTVLLRPDDGSYYAVDDVGARIWELCDGTRPLSAVVDALAEEFDAPRDTISADALEFVAELRGERLLVAR